MLNKRFLYLLLPFLFVGLTACETEEMEPGLDDEGVMTAELEAYGTEIDMRLNAFDQEIAQLESDLQAASAEVRDEIDDEDLLEKIREEREDISALRANLMEYEEAEELSEVRTKMREEYRDLDLLLTEARMEMIEERADFEQYMTSEVAEMDREIENLEMRASQVDDAMRAEYQEQAAELRAARDNFQNEWEAFEQSTEENWQDARAGIVEGWRNVKSAVYGIDVPDVDLDVTTSPN